MGMEKINYEKINPKYNLMEAPRYTLLQKIFSIQNAYYNNVKRKIIYILGLKISIKVKRKIQF